MGAVPFMIHVNSLNHSKYLPRKCNVYNQNLLEISTPSLNFRLTNYLLHRVLRIIILHPSLHLTALIVFFIIMSSIHLCSGCVSSCFHRSFTATIMTYPNYLGIFHTQFQFCFTNVDVFFYSTSPTFSLMFLHNTNFKIFMCFLSGILEFGI